MPRSFLRPREAESSVTNIELFFDLVYVFAVTQMSHHLLGSGNPSWSSALQTLILLGLIWLAWVYTTWVTNWLDPDRDPLRLLLIALMLGSLALAAVLPEAFGHWGLVIGVIFAAMHVGRSAIAVLLLRGTKLQANYLRILAWCTLSGVAAVMGGIAQGTVREVLWIVAIGIDLLGSAVGFRTPGLGRSTVEDWTIDGGHFAERCQAFILIALGESLVIIGTSLGDEAQTGSLPAAKIAAFLAAFVGVVGLWWVYFDRSGPAGAEVIANAEDPGRLARSAYHAIHPIMVAGIIVTAAADELVFRSPTEHPIPATAWTVLGGTALFLLGHAAFTAVVWRTVPWSRLIAVCLIAFLALIATHVTTLALGTATGAIILLVCITDRVSFSRASSAAIDRGGEGIPG
jgi:low temperature requirement protein LtrA